MGIADRALAAYESEIEEKRLADELSREQSRGRAVVAIMAAAESLGIDVDPDAVGLISMSYVPRWQLIVQVDDDASLHFLFQDDVEGNISMQVKAADQLYWDLPPGQKVKPAGGGTYGCYGLNADQMKVSSLADLGRQIAKVRKARERWQAKHGA